MLVPKPKYGPRSQEVVISHGFVHVTLSEESVICECLQYIVCVYIMPPKILINAETHHHSLQRSTCEPNEL